MTDTSHYKIDGTDALSVNGDETKLHVNTVLINVITLQHFYASCIMLAEIIETEKFWLIVVKKRSMRHSKTCTVNFNQS